MVTEVDTKKAEKASGIAVSEDVNKDLKNKINKWRCLCQSPTQRSWDSSTGKKSGSSYTRVTGQPVQLFITGSFIYVNPHFFWPNDAPQQGGGCHPGCPALVPWCHRYRRGHHTAQGAALLRQHLVSGKAL